MNELAKRLLSVGCAAEMMAWLWSDRGVHATKARQEILQGVTPPVAERLRDEWSRRELPFIFQQVKP